MSGFDQKAWTESNRGGRTGACQRPGCPNQAQPPFRNYCSDACRDTTQRQRARLRKAQQEAAPKFRLYGRYRVYPAGTA